jgi:hypothetical protein
MAEMYTLGVKVSGYKSKSKKLISLTGLGGP